MKTKSNSTGTTYFTLTLLFLAATVFMGYSQEEPSEKGLKDYYKDHFPVGVAVSPRALEGESAELILKHLLKSMMPF